jgi:hypothetical protein
MEKLFMEFHGVLEHYKIINNNDDNTGFFHRKYFLTP